MLRHVDGELLKGIWQAGIAFTFKLKQFKERSRKEMTSLCNRCTVVSRCVFCVEPLDMAMTRNFSALRFAGLFLWVVRSVENMCLSSVKSKSLSALTDSLQMFVELSAL